MSNLLSETINFLDEYADLPIFNVKIGICSPQLENVPLDEALEEFNRVGGGKDRDNIEYAYIFVKDFVKENDKINILLTRLGVGVGL